VDEYDDDEEGVCEWPLPFDEATAVAEDEAEGDDLT
jgi:hypothetical protein